MPDHLTRRTMLGMSAGAIVSPALSNEPLRVLFIGNSFTLEHDLPNLFADIVRQTGQDIHVDMIAQGGAHLADYLEGTSVREIYEAYRPDRIVLQDYSTVALESAAAVRSYQAIQAFCELWPYASRFLFATWPRREDHRLFNQPNMPDSAAEMNRLTERHYGEAAECGFWERNNVRVAPVGRAWILGTGLALHRSDGYHASLTGAWLSALVLARTMGLAPSRPVAPDGVKVPARLHQIARMVAP